MSRYQELYTHGKFQELLEYSLQNITSAEAKYWNITALWRMGKFEEAIDKGLNYSNKIEHNDIEWKAKMLHRLGTLYHGLAELEIAQEYYQKSLALKEIFGDQEEISATLNNIGIIHFDKGEFRLALKYYQRSLQIKIEHQSDKELAPSLNNMALVYRTMGQLDIALDYFRQCLEINRKNQNSQDISYSLQNIGKIYRDNGEFEVALENFQESLELRKQIGHDLNTVEMYMDIVVTLVELGDLEKAQTYFDDLENIARASNNRKIKLFRDYSLGIIKKSSKRSRDKAKAQEIFEALIQYNDFDFYLLIKIYSHLVELLIFEYKSYEEVEVLNEIIAYSTRMLNVAKKQKMYSVLLDVLILQSRLDIIQNKFDTAYAKMEEALKIAEEREMDRYLDTIKIEKDMLHENISDLKDVIENSSVSSKLDEIALMDYIKVIQKGRK